MYVVLEYFDVVFLSEASSTRAPRRHVFFYFLFFYLQMFGVYLAQGDTIKVLEHHVDMSFFFFFLQMFGVYLAQGDTIKVLEHQVDKSVGDAAAYQVCK